MYEYLPATDQFNLKEGTPQAPKTMEDCYQGDKAGTLTNHARTGITAVDGAGVNVDYDLRPADYVVLGGASNDLWLLIENWAGFTSATIRIVGTDRDGAAQTEDVVVTGNGACYATKWFKTVTQTQVIAVNGAGSFDYKLEQGQFGAISKTGTKSYVVHSNFWLYHYGAYTAALAIEDVCVVFEKDFNRYYTGCYCRLGTYMNGRGANGARVIIIGAQTMLYGSTYIYGSVCNMLSTMQRTDIIDSVILTGTRIYTIDDVWKRVTIHGGLRCDVEPTTPPEDILIHNATIGYFYGVTNGRVWNLTFDQCSSDIYNYFEKTCYYRDCTWNRSKIYSGSNGIIYEEYTINFQATDKNENGISGLSVKLYKNGDYTGLIPDDGKSPVLDTTTDENGKINQTGLVIWKRVSGPTTTDYNPFLVVLSHDDYPIKSFIKTFPRHKLKDGDWTYPYAEEATGNHAQILGKLTKHDKKMTGLVA